MGKDLWGRQRGSRSGPSQGAADDKIAQMRGASQESSAVSELEGLLGGRGREQGGRRLSGERQPLRCPWGWQRWAARRRDTCIAKRTEVGPYAVPGEASLCPAELEGQSQAQLRTVVDNKGNG